MKKETKKIQSGIVTIKKPCRVIKRNCLENRDNEVTYKVKNEIPFKLRPNRFRPD